MRTKPITLAVTMAITLAVAGCAERAAPRDVKEQRSQAQETDTQLAGKNDTPLFSEPPPAPPAPPAEPLKAASPALAEETRKDERASGRRAIAKPVMADKLAAGTVGRKIVAQAAPPPQAGYTQPANTERYQDHADNPVHRTSEDPVSTFSIDVDTGSYANVRRMLRQGQLPPADAVRAEEFLNYFDYAYTPPADRKTPFSVTTEVAPAPWNAQRQLMLVGIKGYEVPKSQIPAANIVFLIDTSGSMESPDKLPLLRDAFIRMLPNLRAQDRVSIVVYAGSAGLVLPPTPGDQHERIGAALANLAAGGSTNGGAGISLAYATARQAFIKGGVNRVILATDGDFNVGTVDNEALKTIVAEQRKSGIALTTLGFGAGNYNEELSEQLADIGDGNHAYIDTLDEARKVLGDELSSTMLTIAKDVKIQVEFNPALVAEYRLIGYENRRLNREDFNNDKVDAGEIGAGHDVTALYELTLVESKAPAIDPLRYGDAKPAAGDAKPAELAFVKLRYKQPESETSTLVEVPVKRDAMASAASERLRFAASVAAFADGLRGGTHLGTFDLAAVARLARSAKGGDTSGYREEFVQLVEQAAALKTPQVAAAQIAR